MNKGILVLLFFLVMPLPSFSQGLQPTEELALLECVVQDPEKIGEEGAVVLIESENKSFSKQGKTDIDGKFKLLAPEGQKYAITVKKFGEEFHFNIELPLVDGGAEFTQPLTIKLVKSYVRSYNLDHLYFETNKWDIKNEALPTLQKLYANFLKSKTLKIEIAGHTDNVGDEANNHRLSQKRADAIRAYLIKKGINEDRVLAKGYGEKEPIASNDTEEGRAKNRRTEIKIIEE